MIFAAAPMQGYTDAPWRAFHRRLFPGAEVAYFTPFIRMEKGEVRPRDLRDFTSALNDDNPSLAVQLIFRDRDELKSLLTVLSARGCFRVNLNLGCPFPLQTRKGRGAGLLARPDTLREAVDLLSSEYPQLRVSVKMRTGLEDDNEWRAVMPALEALHPDFIILHPRTARQQYGGRADRKMFGEFLSATDIPVIYNGDIQSPDDIADIVSRFPGAAGVMAGRGLTARPSLFEEYLSGREYSESERREQLTTFHNAIFDYRASVLSGDSQILSCMRPFWDYAEDVIGHKAFKAIKKASTLSRYREALNLI